MVFVAGLDLAAKENRPSGLAIAKDNIVIMVSKVYSDEEILDTILKHDVKVVAVDAPLSHARTYRKVDLEMKRKGLNVLPPGWRTMKPLVDRAIALKDKLNENGVKVIETHPRSTLKTSGYKNGMSLISTHLTIEPYVLNKLSKDEIDALICLLVAYYYVKGDIEKIEADDGVIYLLPKLKD